ncbi:ubiquinone biosynthesis protein [Methylomarinovum caldicuralii]|uniref:Probable protein kinase UbiB n=1 Tax=Methylomarinovum caldicuralii TaxID=438856 RepID=A0AAU9C051_9GAMM|nr:ubiquinone biosynthesis regulatory protein kinase UbiB [Methylomarinovum caldicuralii]BCX80475.1 ubiquinone biosynthesis protein [Methylomarinovum caldicuralii]
MTGIFLFWRLLQIQRILLRHGLDELILGLPWLRPVRFLRWLSPNAWRRCHRGTRGERIRRALEELGPIYVKFGQAVSTRRDLLPDDIADELEKLQDRVPPFPGDQARAIVEAQLGRPVSEIFAEFDETPLASASIAQVHPARLRSGEAVVVKVLRPGIEARIREDVALMALFATLVERFIPEARRLRPRAVVAEFDKTLHDELDLVREAANAAELRRHFEDSEILYVPKVYFDWTRPQVLVIERIHGIPVTDVEALRDAGVDFKLLAERGVEIFFTQVFRDNFFHADMHPGNVFVDPRFPARYMAVDFGIVASLSEADQYYLAANLLAFFNRDYRRVAEMHVASGWVPADVRVEAFEGAIRAVCEPIFAKPLGEISYAQLLLRLFQTARRFRMEVQPQLVLLQKTLLQIEGLGRQLYPELDLWQTAKPFLEDWFRRRVHPRTLLYKTWRQLPQWAEQLPEVPTWALRLMDQASHGRLPLQLPQLEAWQLQQRRQQRRTVAAIGGGAMMISASVLIGVGLLSPLTLGLAGLGGVMVLRAYWEGGSD